MARVGVFSAAPRKWFPFDADTEVELEFINKERMVKLVAKADDAAKRVGGTANVIYDIFLGKAAIHGWRKKDDHNHPGLLLPNNDPIPFSEENRNMLMKSCSEFSTFVFRNCTDSAGFLMEDCFVPDAKTLAEYVAELDLEEEAGKNA